VSSPGKADSGGPRWTKDKAGATAAAVGVGYAALVIFGELIRPFAYAYTVSALLALGFAWIAYRVMLRIMRRLPS